jgi:glycosyltransferase involved in cell wall biosynthesis
LRPDVALVFGVGNSVFAQALHLLGIPTAVNVDGTDWKRKKWGSIGRRYLRWSEAVAAHLANGLITDSLSMVGYYRLRYQADAMFIPYGAEIPSSIGKETLARFGLEPRKYLLTVGRLVPENGIDNLIHAYKDSGCSWPLVVVGDSQYSVRYKRYLRDIAPPGVIFTGYQFGNHYHELSAHAYAFLYGGEVGGTHPVLVEQLRHGNCIVALRTDSNAEVIGSSGLLYDSQSELVNMIASVLTDQRLVGQIRRKALERSGKYSWDQVTDQYEMLAAMRIRQKNHRRQA